MARPLFSIVIPTRERPETLAFALRTCLNQDFDDYEIVVSDNCGSPATREVVEACGSPRIKYVRSDRLLAMSANFELGVSQATGEYVTAIGDDDGMMPYALRELDRLIRRHGRPAAVHWHRATYVWPSAPLRDEANVLRVPLIRFEKVVSGRAILEMVIRYELTAASLPMINNAIIHRDLIDRHKRQAGRLFINNCPDIYTAFAFGYLCGTYVSVGAPMNMNGIGPKSNALSTLSLNRSNNIADDFFQLNQSGGFFRHPTVPDVELIYVHVDDSFQFARDTLFPNDPDLVMDRKTMAERHLNSMPQMEPDARLRVREQVRNSLSDCPDLLQWFDNAPDPPPGPVYTNRPERFGLISNSELAVDASRFGVRDIVGAVEFTTDILGYRSVEIPYKPE